MEKKRILLLDMYGVIIKESKGYFIPYTFEHFDTKEHDRLTKAFREECLFTKAGNGELSSDEFLSMLGYPNPTETMQDYLTNFLTLDQDFLWFAERNYKQYDFVLLSNDVKEWSKYLFELYGLQKYFKECIVSGKIHMRKPENRIFAYSIKYMHCNPQECIFVDNNVQNLNAAQNVGIDTILFNRDNETYSGNIVNNFQELDCFLKKSV
ncbi:MAG: HAD-IA family hydrolase [Lachnospiraceae bacterium]|nr:HAD-IA family hydrolase [Lachnospiraceae bacterium]